MIELIHVAWRDQYIPHHLAHVFGLDLYCADPARPLTTAGEEIQ